MKTAAILAHNTRKNRCESHSKLLIQIDFFKYLQLTLRNQWNHTVYSNSGDNYKKAWQIFFTYTFLGEIANWTQRKRKTGPLINGEIENILCDLSQTWQCYRTVWHRQSEEITFLKSVKWTKYVFKLSYCT